MSDPQSVYQDLLEQRRAAIAQLERQHGTFGYYRLATIAAAIAVAWWALAGNGSIVWVTVPVGAFVALAVIHDRRLRELERRRRAARYYEKGLARLKGEWAGTGESGSRFLRPEHPYAVDLDLFGSGSLFELLCSARTHIGEDTLAGWLLAPADPATVRARQNSVEELRPNINLREQLFIVAEEARAGVDPTLLAEWGEQPAHLGGRATRLGLMAAQVLGAAGLVSGIIMLSNSGGFLPLSDSAAILSRLLFFGAAMINGAFYFKLRIQTQTVVAAVEGAAHELGLLAGVLDLIERENFQSPRLAGLRASLDSAGAPPSKRLARLRTIMDYLDSRDNVFVRATGIFTMWTPHWALRVEDWRRESGATVRRWFAATGEIEALCSFASHAFEHPADPFPEFVETGAGLDAESIGHPLIAEDKVVRNDFKLGWGVQLLIVSGSNMSGKSTLLRTLGTNLVLAQAGAPVRARMMKVSPLQVGASIHGGDSLQGGVSRFYAEILRLRQLLDLAGGPLPLFFMIDELLNGTNSHDRKIGAEAIVRGLVQRGAIGLVTTHDLALAGIVETLGGRAANVHFEDTIEEGKIHFDYHMRPGVVQKSNAIELMRSVGLEI